MALLMPAEKQATLSKPGPFRSPVLLLAAVFCGLLALTATAAETERTIELSLKDLDGKQHTLAEYRGKWVVVNFWATSCPPCIKEMPELSDFHDRHKDRDAVVLGVNFEDIRLSWMRRFLDSVDVTYPILPWGTSPATPFGLIIALPTTFIVSPSGTSVARYTGQITAADIEAYIEGQSSASQTEQAATEHKAPDK
jgi:thiol-disulfide isomerase/thioredoxin